MPTHCCVPECKKKGYRDENGVKVSFFKFPTENPEKKKWLHAIRREEGKFFKVTKFTKICSRHFREGEIKVDHLYTLTKTLTRHFSVRMVFGHIEKRQEYHFLQEAKHSTKLLTTRPCLIFQWPFWPRSGAIVTISPERSAIMKVVYSLYYNSFAQSILT